MPLPWGVVREWRRIEPTEAHSSVPKSVILAMIVTSLLRGFVKSAAGVWLASASGLRPVEYHELPWRDISFPEDRLDYESHSIFISIHDAKGAWAGSAKQSARAEDIDLLEFLRAVKAY